jgi:LysM repeat protein
VTGWNPARLLAPIALVATAVALFGIVASGGGGSNGGAAGGAAPDTGQKTQSASPTPSKKKATRQTYTVKPGDTPSTIAEQAGIPLDQLLELNPNLDPQSLNPGDKLRIR